MMRNICLGLLVALALGFGGQSVSAQDATDTSYNQRVELAKQMHELRPIDGFVDGAIANVASSSYPPGAGRDGFASALRSGLNAKTIYKISVDAMVDVYTVEELGAMVEYYSKPAARSAADKGDEWVGRVAPEVRNMIDKAIMRMRTGR